MYSESLLLPITDGRTDGRGGGTILSEIRLLIFVTNFLENHSNVSWQDLLALEAIT